LWESQGVARRARKKAKAKATKAKRAPKRRAKATRRPAGKPKKKRPVARRPARFPAEDERTIVISTAEVRGEIEEVLAVDRLTDGR
jgi:hypothetical protein